MGMQTPVAALQRLYAAEERYIASGRDDFAPIAATLHPEAVLYEAESLPYGGEWRGHDGFERFFAVMAETWSSVAVQDVEFIEQGDTVVVLLTMEARARATGTFVRSPLCQVVRVRDGLPIEIRPFYWDTAAINAALGVSISAPLARRMG